MACSRMELALLAFSFYHGQTNKQMMRKENACSNCYLNASCLHPLHIIRATLFKLA